MSQVRSTIKLDASPQMQAIEQEKVVERNYCTPKKNVLFLKTHKTGSSSVQNIFFRFGDKHNLTFVLPRQGNYFGHPQPFHRQMAVHSPARLLPGANLSWPTQNNIFTHHARFNYEEMKAIMPADTIFVTILRDPGSLMQSLLSYYDIKRLHYENSTDQLLLKLFSSSPTNSSYYASLNKRILGRLGRNQMSFDLGLDIENFDKLDTVRKFIKTIDSRFDLVMIVDRMEESLVLLQRILCWTVDDMIVFRHNVRNVNMSTNTSSGIESKRRLFNVADELLYNYFRAKLARRIAEFGQTEMKKQIISLQQSTDAMYHKCVEKAVPMRELEPPKRIWFNNRVLGFKQKQNTSKDCGDLTNPELYYTDLLRHKQNISN